MALAAEKRAALRWTLRQIWLNLRYAFRILARSPGFTAVAVLSLALGVGANTAIFTLINALLLRELPVHQPERLVRLRVIRGDGRIPFSYPMFQEVERGQRVFDGMMAWSSGASANTEIAGALSQTKVQTVTCNAHLELGAMPLLGRLLEPQDCEGGGAQIAVLGYDFWKRRFGGRADIVGTPIRIEGHAFTIIGVTRKWFSGIRTGEAPELTLPLTAEPLINGPDFRMDNRALLWLSPVGRLKAGVTIAQARAHLQSFWPAVLLATASTQTPGLRRQTFLSMSLEVTSVARGLPGTLQEDFSQPLYILAGIVALILLVACVNLANLLLARAASRQQEMSVRMAIGASRSAVARQILTESLMLSFAGAALGALLSFWGCRLLLDLMSEVMGFPVSLDLNPDARVLLVTLGIAVLTGVLFGVAPAWFSSREYPAQVLQRNARTLGGGTNRAGRALIAVQVALSLVLLLSATLLVRSFQYLRTSELGVHRQGILEVMLNPKPGGYENLDLNVYHKQLLQHVAVIPGVEDVSYSGSVVPSPNAWQETVSLAGSDPNSGVRVIANANTVSPGFFRSLRLPILKGREFEDSDDEHHPAAVIVSANLAEKLFPNGDAVGQTIRFGFMPEHQNLRIVGVAANARIFDPLAVSASPLVYFSYLWKPEQWGALLVRTNGAPEALTAAVGHELESMGHEYAIRTKTVDNILGEELVDQRVMAILSTFFAALALVLACVGVYGLMSYAVKRRTREIGIRVAVGAQQRGVLWMILRETLNLSLLGIAIGIPTALAASKLLRSMLVGVSPTDPAFLVGASLILLVLALGAAYVPARRATRIDPISALRAD